MEQKVIIKTKKVNFLKIQFKW